MYITAKSIDDYDKANKNQKLNISGQDERELEAALKKSLEETGEEGEEQKKPDSPKFMAFTGQGVSLGGDEPAKGVDKNSELY